MLEEDIVRPSTSPWASPVVMVDKKDGSGRFCFDYQRLNQVAHFDANPMPHIHTLKSFLIALELQSSFPLSIFD